MSLKFLEKERGFRRLPSFLLSLFLLVSHRLFQEIVLVQIWPFFLYFEGSNSFEFLKF